MVKTYWKEHRFTVSLLLIALVIRIIYLVTYQYLPEWDHLTVDNNYHHNWALSIAGSNILGDTTYFRAPFYVICLAFLYWVFSASLWTARIFGIVIGLLSVLMTYKLGREIFNHRIAFIAALIHSVYPTIIYFESELLLDSFFMFLLLSSLYLFLRWYKTKAGYLAIVSGLLMGLAVITRPTGLVITFILVVYVVITEQGLKRSASGLLKYLLPVAVIIGTIFMRNLMIAEDPVLIASQGGINFYIGNNETADGVSAGLPEPMDLNWQIREITYVAEQEVGRSLKPGEVSAYWTSKAWDWITENPMDFMMLNIRKLYFCLSNSEVSNNRNLPEFFKKLSLLRYSPLSFGWLMLLAVLGIMVSYREFPLIRLILVICIVYMFAIAIFFFSSRFRLPLLPLFILLASCGIFSLKNLFSSSIRKALIPVSLALVAGVISFLPLEKLMSTQIDPSGNISRGLNEYSRGDFRSALSYFQLARLADSTYPEVNLNCGVSFMKLGMLDSAKYYFDQEIRFNPRRHRTYINLASLMLLDNKYSDALKAASKAIDLRAYDPTANAALVRAASAIDSISDDSLRVLVQNAAYRTNNDVYFLVDAAGSLLNKNLIEDALDLYILTLESQPPPIETDDEAFQPGFRNSPIRWRKKQAEAAYQAGYINGLQQRFGESIRLNRKAIELDSSLAEAYVNLAAGYVSVGQLEQARLIAKQAVQRFPDNTTVKQLLQ